MKLKQLKNVETVANQLQSILTELEELYPGSWQRLSQVLLTYTLAGHPLLFRLSRDFQNELEKIDKEYEHREQRKELLKTLTPEQREILGYPREL